MGDDTESRNSWLPRMPRFRRPDGRVDWRQMADMVIPGNVWDSHTQQARPIGMVAGVLGSYVPGGGALTEAIYANRDNIRMPNFSGIGNPFGGLGQWLSGRTGRAREDRGFLGPTARPTADRPTIPNFANNDNWGTTQPQAPSRDPNFRMQGVSDARAPSPTRGGTWRRTGPGGRWNSDNGGMGNLNSAVDEMQERARWIPTLRAK